MPDPISWAFFGYCSSAGRRDVQRWWYELRQEERDEIRDELVYYAAMPYHFWSAPGYKPLGDGVGEFRFKVGNRAIRLYGFCWPGRLEYTFLNAGTKARQADDIREARHRKSRLESGEASVHEFDFQDKPF